MNSKTVFNPVAVRSSPFDARQDGRSAVSGKMIFKPSDGSFHVQPVRKIVAESRDQVAAEWKDSQPRSS
jgi:hypothetical protein